MTTDKLPELLYATYQNSWRWWAALAVLLVGIIAGFRVGFELSPGWTGADLTPGPKGLITTPRWPWLNAVTGGMLLTLAVMWAIYYFIDKQARLWWLYGPACGIALGIFNFAILTDSWINVHRDPAPLSYIGPVKTVVTSAEWENSRRRTKWIGRERVRVRYLKGLRYYMVAPDPWDRSTEARLYWSRADLPWIPKEEADARWLELERLNAPLGWPGQCLHATVGKGAHGDRWISRDRRIAPCP